MRVRRRVSCLDSAEVRMMRHLGAEAGSRSGSMPKEHAGRSRYVTCSTRAGARQYWRCCWQLVDAGVRC
jgi:hypothetical protein